MSKAEILKLFKRLVVEEGLTDSQVYLFGSRARKILNIKNNLCMKFHDHILSSIDILIKDRKTFTKEKNIPNTISFAVDKEGLRI